MAEFWLDVLATFVALLLITSALGIVLLILIKRIGPFVQAMKGAMGVTGPITKFRDDSITEHVQEFRPKEQSKRA